MSGATVSINPKLADGTIVQVGGVGYDDFVQNLAGFVGAENVDSVLAEIRQRVTPVSAGSPDAAALAAVRESFPGTQPVQQANTQFPNTAAPRAQPAPAVRVTPPTGTTPACHHGTKTYRNGEKNGKAWQGYFCPSPKGTPDQCPPDFIR